MALTPAQVRQRVAASISSRLGHRWTESAYSYDQFPGRESFEIIDRAFTVGLGRTIPEDTDGRQRRSRALVVVTEVRVRFSASTRAEEMVGDYDRSLDYEHELVQAVMATTKDPDLEIRFDGVETRRSVLQGVAFLGECRFDVRHGYELA